MLFFKIYYLFTYIQCQLILPQQEPSPQNVGGMVPNGFGERKNLRCACEYKIQCPPCSQRDSFFEQNVLSQCNCISKLPCQECPDINLSLNNLDINVDNSFKKFTHEKQESAKKQMQYFQQAEQYANEMQLYQMRARQAQILLKEAQSKAEIARQKMLQVQAQAKELDQQELIDQFQGYQNINLG